MMRKGTKGKSVGKKIRPMKENGYDVYEAIIDKVEKYGDEGGSMTVEYDLINTLKDRKYNVKVWDNN